MQPHPCPHANTFTEESGDYLATRCLDCEETLVSAPIDENGHAR